METKKTSKKSSKNNKNKKPIQEDGEQVEQISMITELVDEQKNRDVSITLEPIPKQANAGINQQSADHQQVAVDLGSSEPIYIGNEQTEPQASKVTELDDDSTLPKTLTILNTANGSEVYLVGTAHFSTNSVKDVQKVIQLIKPNFVVLELCKERAFMLSLDESALLEANKNLTFEKIRNAIRQKGFRQGLIYTIFIKVSASLTEKLGIAPGSELRAGANEAKKIPGCNIVLGDRSLKVTLARAVASVSAWQKIKLVYQVLTNDVTMTQEEVEKCKEKDILEQLLKELGVEFPGFKRVILDERNIYLAHSIYHYAQNYDPNSGPQKIVAIVGIGHVAGIVEHWGKTKDEDVLELNKIPEVSKTRRIVTKTMKYCSIAILMYVGYRIVVPTALQNIVTNKLTRSA